MAKAKSKRSNKVKTAKLNLSAETVSQTINLVTELAQPLMEELGLDLLEVQYSKEFTGLVLRLIIDREPDSYSNDLEAEPISLGSGVTLENCSRVSRELGYLLDINDSIATQYTLEVSSPGLDRLLRYPVDFKRYVGCEVNLRVKDAEGRTKKFNGILEELGPLGEIILEIKSEKQSFSSDKLISVRLVPQLKW